MGNKPGDFDFDDDIFGNGNDDIFGNGGDSGGDEVPDEFDFGDGPELSTDELPTGTIPAAEGDMPEIVVEPEPGGGVSRTFVLLALALVAIFVIGLIGLVLLATRPAPINPLDLTSTQVVLLNATVEAQLAATQTQSAEMLALTLTAAAASPTPEPTDTPEPATVAPTETLVPTEDPAILAQTQQALAFSGTATALAQPSAAPTEVPATPTPAPTGLPSASPTTDYGLLFATEAAYATQAANVDSAIFATLEALATSAAANVQQPVVVTSGPDQQATQIALGVEAAVAATAAASINQALDEFALTAAPLQTQIAALTPAAQATSAALSAQVAALQATQSAALQQVGSLVSTVVSIGTPAPVATLDALATQIAALQGADPAAAQATQVAAIAVTQAAINDQITQLESQIATQQQILAEASNQLAQATSQPPSDPQATQVAQFEATVTAGTDIIGSLTAQITVLRQQLADLDTLAGQIGSQPPADVQATEIAALQATQGALSLEVVSLQATIDAAGPLMQGTLDAAAAQIAAANQQLVAAQAQQATQAAQATQAMLETREALVQQLVSGTVVAIVPTSPLDAVNQTATALATFFQTPAAQEVTQEATSGFPTAVPTAEALPETGIFDEVGGDSFAILGIALVGLVGVIVVARVMRRRNDKDDNSSDE